MTAARTRQQLEDELHALLDRRYHHRHPFNLRMHTGALDREAIQIWVRNRYYYQTRIPIKDSVILTKSTDPQFRREWVHRLQDHDGEKTGEGGLELWLGLAEAVGLAREEVAALHNVVPGVRRACDAYVDFVASHDLLESVAASLTELRAGEIMKARIAAFERHYSWVRGEGLAYFRSRTTQAPRDAGWGIAFVLESATERADQDRCLEALARKCTILWSLLDAVDAAASKPRLARHAMLRPGGDATMVVLPERAVEIAGSGVAILEHCDGQRRGQDIATAMRAQHPDAGEVENDVYDFIQSMHEVGVLEYAEEDATH